MMYHNDILSNSQYHRPFKPPPPPSIHIYRVYPIRSMAPNRSTHPFLTAMCHGTKSTKLLYFTIKYVEFCMDNKSYNNENL